MTAPTAPGVAAFDVTAELPRGTWVLEASAGTGKTWTIAALVARYVAEGTPLPALMMVTFSRAASRELRTRIRERLERSRRVLEQAVAGTPAPPGEPDAVDRLLVDTDPAGLVLRRHRMDVALADFDAATIATTHEFCQRMLDSLGVLADADPRAVLVEHLDDLTDQVARDHFVRRFAAPGAAPPPQDLDLDTLARLAREAVRQPALALAPHDDPETDVRLRVELVTAVREEVQRRKRRLRLQTFDDVLIGLSQTLAHPEHGEAAQTRLRSRFPVVLIDEFQDTDPVQWSIVDEAFVGHSTVVLIGDPKQAIYQFRGADVHSYLAAVEAADRVLTLGENHRSDPTMVDAVAELCGGASLGEDRIRVHPVTPALTGQRIRHGEQHPVPLQLRQVPGLDLGVAEARELVLADLVSEVSALLAPAAPGRPVTELAVDGEGWRALRASDLAVLVRRNQTAEQVRTALARVGVAAVVNGGRSVHDSEAAEDWGILLEALLDPRQRQLRRASRTLLVGWGLDELALADDVALAELSRRVKEWARLLESHGVAAVAERIGVQQRLAERMLARPGGERELTDLRQVAEGLHQAQTQLGLGPAGLLTWLGERHERAGQERTERARRLESDAAAVQILTYHHSKGLQFPVVLLPSGWDRHQNKDDGRVLTLRTDDDAAVQSPRVLDVGGLSATGRGLRLRRHEHEEAGEELRQLYVSLTRAQCRVIAWWGSAKLNTPTSGLQRMLHRPPGASQPPERVPARERPPVGRWDPRLIEVVEVTPVATPPPGPSPDAVGEQPELRARRFERPLDLAWRRTSYTGLTAAAHGTAPPPVGVGSDPALEQADDEPAVEEQEDAQPRRGYHAPVSPLAAFPGGTAFGTLVHTLLEQADPSSEDLVAELTTLAARQLARLPRAGFSAGELAQALLPALGTPLGPLLDDLRLLDLPTTDRLAELDFELPLAGGRRPGRHATLADVADCLQAHLDPGDPLAAYPDRLRDPVLGTEVLRGFLTGSIDAVLRTPADAAGHRRHVVVDYKTNWLGPRPTGGEDDPPLTIAGYHPDALAEAMMTSHYPLQALLYAVALHRQLRVRLKGYDPEHHLGGICYLFVRGMAGASTPTVDGVAYGVFSWRPSSALVSALSRLLAHGPGAAEVSR